MIYLVGAICFVSGTLFGFAVAAMIRTDTGGHERGGTP
jgi:hypothetical protein